MEIIITRIPIAKIAILINTFNLNSATSCTNGVKISQMPKNSSDIGLKALRSFNFKRLMERQKVTNKIPYQKTSGPCIIVKKIVVIMIIIVNITNIYPITLFLLLVLFITVMSSILSSPYKFNNRNLIIMFGRNRILST